MTNRNATPTSTPAHASAPAAVSGRRRFLKRASVGMGAAWVAPTLITAVASPAAAASVLTCRVEFDGLCNELAPNTVTSSCEPTDWGTTADCALGTVTCSEAGGVITLSYPSGQILSAIAEDAGPSGAGCVDPDNTLPASSTSLTPKAGNSIVVVRAVVCS